MSIQLFSSLRFCQHFNFIYCITYLNLHFTGHIYVHVHIYKEITFNLSFQAGNKACQSYVFIIFEKLLKQWNLTYKIICQIMYVFLRLQTFLIWNKTYKVVYSRSLKSIFGFDKIKKKKKNCVINSYLSSFYFKTLPIGIKLFVYDTMWNNSLFNMNNISAIIIFGW